MGRLNSPLMLPADPTATLHATTKRYVDALIATLTSNRGPAGGVTGPTSGGSLSMDARASNRFRHSVTASGGIVGVPSNGVDGQEITVELYASGGDRSISLASVYELGQNVASTAIAITSGKVAYVRIACRVGWPGTGTVWRALAIDAG